MSGRKRTGFTLPEALVAGAMFLCIAAAFFFTWNGSRREEELASLHLSMLESAALAMQQLRTDLREMVVICTAAVDGTSLRVTPSGDALMLRQELLGDQPTSPCAVVQYTTIPAATRSGQPRFHLQRTRRTSDGSNLPGGASPRDVKVFRTFTLKGVSFNYLHTQQGSDPTQGDAHLIHATFQVVSDTGRASAADPFGEKSMLLTQVLRFLKPPHPDAFAQIINVPGLEVPPQDVVSDAITELPPLPAIEE